MRALAIAAFALVLGCSTHHSGPPDDSKATLSIDPATSTLTIVNDAPASEDFTATATYPDGSTRDVTSEVRFAVDESYGAFTAATLTMAVAGKTTVTANWYDKTASAEVIAKLLDVRVDPSLPPNVADWFNTPEDPSHAPTVAYPPANVTMPRNIGDFEVHWTDASANDVYEVSLTTTFADVRVYLPGTKVMPAPAPGAAWMEFLAKEWAAAVGFEQTVAVQVRGVVSANPTSVGSAPPQLVKLSNENMLGGLYYWASTSTTGVAGIFRHDMSMPGTPAQQYMTTAQTGGRCVACHVLSRDGHEMAITYDGGNGAATMVDVGSSVAATSQRGWNFGTFTPDGKQFLAVQNGVLTVLDYQTQAALATMAAAGPVSHPDLSPDGTRLVYVREPGGNDWSFAGGSLFVRSFDPTTEAFGPEQQLVADGANNYYPSWSPDGQWILFNKDTGNASSYNNADAELFVIKSDGTQPAMPLAIMNKAAGLTDSWGRWAPFAQTIGSSSEQMYWITVSSKRDFGVRLVGANKPQVWMAPFFPDRAAANQDPSDVAFRLPFQAIESNNHIAQWTEQVVTQ